MWGNIYIYMAYFKTLKLLEKSLELSASGKFTDMTRPNNNLDQDMVLQVIEIVVWWLSRDHKALSLHLLNLTFMQVTPLHWWSLPNDYNVFSSPTIIVEPHLHTSDDFYTRLDIARNTITSHGISARNRLILDSCAHHITGTCRKKQQMKKNAVSTPNTSTNCYSIQILQ